MRSTRRLIGTAPRERSAFFLALVAVGAAASMLLSGTALADAKVVVELKDAAGKPAEGEVSLHKKTGEKIATCKTTGGKCDMSGVAGGNYEVRVVPEKGAAPKPRSAMIPPEGTATLIVSTGS